MSANSLDGIAARTVLQQVQDVRELLRQGQVKEASAFLGELAALMQALRADERELHRRQELLDQANAEVRAARVRYLSIFDASPECYILTDALGVITEANRAAAALFRRPRAFLTDKPLGLFLDDVSRQSFYKRFAAFNRGDTLALQNWEFNLAQQGAVVPIAASVVALYDDEGQRLGMRWLLRDITPRLRAESALRAEKILSDSLLDTAQAIVLMVDARGLILRGNRYLHVVSGYGEQELAGMAWDMLLPEVERTAGRRLVEDALTFGVGQMNVGRLLQRDRRERRILWSAKALGLEDDSTAGVLLLGHDITDLHEAQQRALEQERLAGIGQVLASLAHESRNALQRCGSCLERLTWRLSAAPESLDLVQRARAAHADLTRMFDELRGYAGPLKLELRRTDLAAAWRSAWEQVTAVHPERVAALREAADGLDLSCQADPFRLAQAFRNILENSFAACPGPVQVEILCREVSLEAGPGLWVAVRDNGPGIAPEQQKKVFEPFYTTKTTGTGLGLAITRRIVEAHGGSIGVGADAATGAEIFVTLPRVAP